MLDTWSDADLDHAERLLSEIIPWVVKYDPNQPRDDAGRWGEGGSGGSDSSGGSTGGSTGPAFGSGGISVGQRVGSLTIVAPKERAFGGKPKTLKNPISKQEAGAIGERIALAWAHGRGASDAAPMNTRRNNFPVDMMHDHEVVEIKTGLVSNGSGSQQWRMTIGEPGQKEKAWLKKASPKTKADWNENKAKAILKRKQAIVRTVSKDLGISAKSRTVAVIIDPDRKVADIYAFPGFHRRIGWKSPQANAGYLASVKYA